MCVLAISVAPHSPAALVCEVAMETISGLSNAKFEFFRAQLPVTPRSPKTVGAGLIPDVALIRNFGAEGILIVKDRKIDPELTDWLAKAAQKVPPTGDALTKAKALNHFVYDTFNPNFLGFPLSGSRRIKQFNLLTALPRANGVPPDIRIGLFLKLRSGECRHRAVALQLALQEAGIPSRLVYGKLRTEIASLFGESEWVDRHAWVVVKGPDGKECILDPMNKFAVNTNWDFDRPLDALNDDDNPRSFSTPSHAYQYTPEGFSTIEAPQELGRGDYPGILPALTFTPSP